MAGHGSLCQQIHSAWSILTAFGLRSIHILTGHMLTGRLLTGILLAGAWIAPAMVLGQSTVPTDLASTSRIRLRSSTDSNIVAPDSPVEISAQIESLTDQASQRLVLRASLLRAEDGQTVATNREIVAVDTSGNSGPHKFEFTAPPQEGVYEVRIDLTVDDENIWSRFRKPKPPIDQLGRPIVVIRNDQASAVIDGPVRPVLVHLPDLKWVESLMASEPSNPSSDPEFQATCDPTTKHAQRVWSATGRLSQFIQSNGLTGALITTDTNGNVWPNTTDDLTSILDFGSFDHAGDSPRSKVDLPSNVDLLIAVMRGRGIDTKVIPEGTVPIINLTAANPKLQFPSAASQTPHAAELSIGSALGKEDHEILAVALSFAGDSISDIAKEMLQTVSATPAGQLSNIRPVDPSDTTVRVRAGVSTQHGYVSIINLAPWKSEVDLEFASDAKWSVVGNTKSAQDILRQADVRPSHARITLLPGQLVLLKTVLESSDVSVRSWTSGVGGGLEQIERIKLDVTSIVERIGLLSELDGSISLRNGGFEQTGGIGLVGWMHAQHPPGCVQIDDKESFEGIQSLVMTTDPSVSARTWIVSESIEVPESGRLAVSLVMRADKSDDASPHPMRVSIETTRSGKPHRFSADFGVPRNGQWGSRQIVLETDGLEKQNVDSLRLTVDSLAGGQVWLDDVRLHHWFPTAKERDELQSLAFLAVQGLQHGNLSPSSRLLQNQWARYLLSRGPSKEIKPTDETVAPVNEPGVAAKIRSWLPRPLRF